MPATAFPLFVYLRDPMSRTDHDRANWIDPRTAGEVLTMRPKLKGRGRRAVVPEWSSAWPPPPAREEINRSIVERLESARYQEHGFRWSAANLDTLPAWASALELARWRVPARHLGIVDHIDTHLGLSIPTEGGPDLELALDLPWQPWLHEILIHLRWWLRLESIRAEEELEPAIATAYSMPGAPLLELNTWTDQRFAFNYHGRRPLRLLIPEQTVLRLFVGPDPYYVPPTPPIISAASSPSSPSSSPAWPRLTYSAALERGLLDLLRVSSGQAGGVDASAVVARAAVAAAAEEERNIINLAGRIIGTIQFYRDNSFAIEAARRGL